MLSILVVVDPEGRPVGAEILASSGHIRLDAMAKKLVLSSLYVPKKEPDGYKKGEVVITFPIEVR
ncbi:MAG: energy transducer TonB [Acidobacteria bacterium]|nr:energy transducer TonB [Acidobacteriota bacterium]